MINLTLSWERALNEKVIDNARFRDASYESVIDMEEKKIIQSFKPWMEKYGFFYERHAKLLSNSLKNDEYKTVDILVQENDRNKTIQSYYVFRNLVKAL